MGILDFELLRFISVGVGSNAVNYSIYLLSYSAGASLFSASAAGYVAGIIFSYHYSKKWVFREKIGASKNNILRFMAIYLIGGLGMSTLIEILATMSVMNHQATWLVGAIFAVINNYLGVKHFVFNTR